MKTHITYSVLHMADSDVLRMVPPETLARIRETNASPVLRAYAIAHEGEAQGTFVGIGKRAVQYFREAVTQIHNKLVMGTPFFHHHSKDNTHEGRPRVGEVVGKAMQDIGGKLYDIAVAYVYPEFADLPLDCASIEAELAFTDNGGGKATAVSVNDITGIALGNSAVDVPGFPGATLLAAVQAFAAQGEPTMMLEEIMAAIKSGGFKPSQVFGREALESDQAVTDLVAQKTQTEVEARRNVQERLGKKLDDLRASHQALEDVNKQLKGQVLSHGAKGVLESLAQERKLDEKQTAFILNRFGQFQPPTEADEAGVKEAVKGYLDEQLGVFNEMKTFFSGEKPPEKNAPPSDGNKTEDVTAPEGNPYIPN